MYTPSPFRRNAFLGIVKEAYAATPYVLMVPGAIAGSQRAHKKKYPVVGGAVAGGLGTGLGGTVGGVLGSALLGGGSGELGALAGATAGGYYGYKLLSNRFERRQRAGEDYVLKKYNLKRPKE